MKAAVALAFLAVLVRGGLTKVTGWFGEQMVQIIQTEPAATPSPKDAEVKKRTKKDGPNKTQQDR